MRYLAPDFVLLIASIFILRLCIKLLRPTPQVNLHENGIPPSDPEVPRRKVIDREAHSDSNRITQVCLSQQEVETSDTESEDGSESEGSSSDSSEETTLPVQSDPPQFVQKLIVFAAGLKVLLSAIMNTAGKVVVTLLLGLAGSAQASTAALISSHCSFSTIGLNVCVYVCVGIMLPSLTSSVYFGVFLGLVWWWVFSRDISMLIFSSLCVMMAIFSGGHLLVLYLYQLPLSQKIVPPHDVSPR